MKKQRKNVLEIIIRKTAEMTGETSSWLGFYEAKLPKGSCSCHKAEG